jgi:hypothetical protein
MKTEQTVTVGMKIEAGVGDDRERGTVVEIDGHDCRIAWEQSACVTTQPIAALEEMLVISR